MTHEIHLTAEEVAEACRQYAQKMKWIDAEDRPNVEFDFEPAYQSNDPRENRTEAILRGATVRMGSGKYVALQKLIEATDATGGPPKPQGPELAASSTEGVRINPGQAPAVGSDICQD